MSNKTPEQKTNLTAKEFEEAALKGEITDFMPYIIDIPGVTRATDRIPYRRQWLIEEGIAIDEIAKTATEDEKVRLIRDRKAVDYYESWLSDNERVRRCLADAGYFHDRLIKDKAASVRCTVVQNNQNYLPRLFRKNITKTEWNTIVSVMWTQKQPDLKLLCDLLSREVPDRLYDYTYEHLEQLREKLTIMEYQPSTLEKTMTVKQLYQQGSPAWARTCSAEKISNIRNVEKTLKDCGAPNTLVELWDEIVGSEDIPPLWVMLDRTYAASTAWHSKRNQNNERNRYA